MTKRIWGFLALSCVAVAALALTFAGSTAGPVLAADKVVALWASA